MKDGTTTGLRPATFQRLQLGAGVFLAGFQWDDAADAQALQSALAAFIEKDEGVLGATRGGGTFQCTPELREVEADGKRYGFVGSAVNDGWNIRLKTTLIETTPENFARAMICAQAVKQPDKPGVTVLTLRTQIADSDYIPKICWVGDTAQGFVLIELDNALNVAGANFTFTDRGEGVLPVEFSAYQHDLTDQDHAPFRIVFFNPSEG